MKNDQNKKKTKKRIKNTSLNQIGQKKKHINQKKTERKKVKIFTARIPSSKNNKKHKSKNKHKKNNTRSRKSN